MENKKNQSQTAKGDGSKVIQPRSFGFHIEPCQQEECSLSTTRGGAIDPCIYMPLDSYISAAYEFEKIMLSLLEYATSVGRVAADTQKARRIELYNILREVVEDSKAKRRRALYTLVFYVKNGEPDHIVEKRYPIFDAEMARTIRELEDVDGVAPRIVCETVLQQIVNRWEAHLANVVRIKVMSDQSLLAKNKIELSYDQLRRSSCLDELRRLFVERVVADAMEGGVEDHLRFLKENLGVDFASCFHDINRLKEVSFHRDVVVHCDGIVSERHCQKMRGICKASEIPKIGSKLETSLAYVFDAWDVIYAAGCFLICQIGRQYVQSVCIKEGLDAVNSFVVNASFEALKAKRYDAARMMLELALEGVREFDVGTLALRVNLALVYKYTGQEKKFKKIIDSKDWDSRDEKHQVVIAVLRKDFKLAYDLLKSICKKDPLYLNYVYEWVVYEDLRKDEKFESEISKIKAFRSFRPHKGKSAILDFNAKPANVRKHFDALFESMAANGSR